jgi:hypothetical protein
MPFDIFSPTRIAHNVPAVYDGLAARIRALRSKDQGRQNVGGVERGRRSRPSETEPRRPKAGAHTGLLGEVPVLTIFTLNIFPHFLL